ncbi:acyl-CoA dehydrogenase family protein [Sporichthya sp.]|uniref:acyl-CoA dehydrogenase family protein n=1 Tax=Sporichthya sp. TaxID=65475 RepID=UPI0017C0042A|nr:acyl-CoA dehydrogenase family protein [Sporichthya sp.]MBA3743225.1 acyl-CoA/acyl-ACP dehydrogenase [Sporichthya sp.]
MRLVFTEEQEELRRSVRRLLEKTSASRELRQVIDSDLGYDPEVWALMADQMGLQGLAIPEEFGGSGYGWMEQVAVLEEMGAVLLCSPYFASVILSATMLLSIDDPEARRDLLPGIAGGQSIATVAFTEDDGRWHDAPIRTTARPGDGVWCLDGHKTYVLDGMTANLILVVAATPGGASLFAVDARSPGLVRTPLETLDQTRRLARLELRGTPARLIGAEGAAKAALARTLDLACMAIAAEQVGGAQRCLDMSVEYAKTRVQFGQPIGTFQVIKHKCADMLLEVESARSAAYYAGWAAGEDPEALPAAASLAKAYCSRAYCHVAAENIQIHGGIGFTWEHDAHLYFKRAKASELLFGDAGEHRELLADRLGIESLRLGGGRIDA